MNRLIGLLLVMVLLVLVASSLGLAAPCAQCKAEVGEGMKFCGNCGTKVPEARAKQRYEGTFPVILYGGPFAPLGEDPNSDTAKQWQQWFLNTIKDIGFNGIGGNLTPFIIEEAGRMGMYAVPSAGYTKVLDDPALTPEKAAEAVKGHLSRCAAYPNIIAVIMHSDPVKPEWLNNWRILGQAWNQAVKDVPLLAVFPDAATWKQFDQAAPVSASNSWVFYDNKPVPDPLPANVCHMNLKEVRATMPGMPVWPWVQALEGWGMLWPSTSDYFAASNVNLAEGVGGAFYFCYKKPEAGQYTCLADENMQPTKRLYDLKTFLPAFTAMGEALASCRIDDALAPKVFGQATANVYVSKTDPGSMYLMVANRMKSTPQLVRVIFPTGGRTVTGLRSFADDTELPVQCTAGNATVDVALEAGAGQLLEIVTAAAAAP